MSTVVCPQCNKDDAIQKVSAIVDGGSSLGGYSYLTGINIADLSNKFLPPSQPNRPTDPGSRFVALASAPFLLVFCLTACCFFYTPFFPLATEGIIFIAFVLSGVVFVVSGVLGDFMFIWAEKKFRREFEEAKTKHEIEKSKWETALRKWNNLYYCHRDGIVDDPVMIQICEPSKFREFIYQGSSS
jgi:hypothetical protein